MRVCGFNVDMAHRPNNLSRRWIETSTYIKELRRQ